MRFLDVFNKISKGDYALTDEAIYSSITNGDELLPLYGGNKNHRTTDRKISVSAKTKRGFPIKIFSGEGIIISLDGSAGSMTYKSGERFALNHHAGFITLRDGLNNKVNLEFFALYLQNFYRSLSVSDGSKTLSLTQIYNEEFYLPEYSIQCELLQSVKRISPTIRQLEVIRERLQKLLEKEFTTNYTEYQAKGVEIYKCIDYMSGNSGLTEEFIYHNLKSDSEEFEVLSSATEERTMMGRVPLCEINGHELKVFKDREGLLVTRNGKAGYTRFLSPGKYTINDHAYILYKKINSPYVINLKWLGIQYKKEFLSYASSADNGTWNMTGFFRHTVIDIPNIDEQEALVKLVDGVQMRIQLIDAILKRFNELLNKEITV